jgi:hypothetical protein
MARLGHQVTARDDAPGSGNGLNTVRVLEHVEPAEPAQRPLIERIGLAAIAFVVVALFAAICLAALSGGELFLGVMAGTGALMTLWAAGATLRRG